MHDDSNADTLTVIMFPADLMTAAKQVARPQGDKLQVEAFKASWLTRLGELLVGKG